MNAEETAKFHNTYPYGNSKPDSLLLARALLTAIEALESYADPERWRGMGTVDCYEAQDALRQIRGEEK